MEFMGTTFSITLGSWRLRFSLALEDVDERAPRQHQQPPHRLRLIPEDEYLHRS